jgi:hypothetical protein
MFLTKEKTNFLPRRISIPSVLWRYYATVDAALETAMATIRSTTATAAKGAHAGDIHDAAVRTHKAVTQAVESRLAYIRRFKGKETLTGEERVAERLVNSCFFDTHAADRSTNNGVDGLLGALEDKRIEVSLYAAARAQAAQTYKQPTLGRGDGGNPDRPTARPDKNLEYKENARSARSTRHADRKIPSPRQRDYGVHRPANSCNPAFDYMQHRVRRSWHKWEKVGASVHTLHWIREGVSIPFKNNRPPP